MTIQTLCAATNLAVEECPCGTAEAHDGTQAVVTPEPDTRLAQLHALYAEAKVDFEAAKAALELVKDGIKYELNQATPNAKRVTLSGQTGPMLSLVYSEPWQFDTKKFKADDPLTYVRYAKRVPRWTLKEAE